MKPVATSLMATILAAGLIAACSQGASNASTSDDVSATDWTLTPIVEELNIPWSIVFLPTGEMVVSEREARLTMTENGNTTEISGGPEALVSGQGGYLGLVLDPGFETNRTLYMAFSEGSADANSTSIFKAQLSADGSALTDGEVIYQSDERGTTYHYGGRLQFMTDGTLLLSLGDAYRLKDDAQSSSNTHGTIIRINSDGSIPVDNPFTDGASPEVYSYGHRNVQGLYVDQDTGTVYAHEHGPKGGDEFNLIEPGNNYGWPVITYGVNYDGTIITRETTADGMEQPIEKWVPSIAPSGLVKYTGDAYEGWQGDFFVGAMNGPKGQKLVRLDMENGALVGTEDLLADLAMPFRDVAQGPDGKLYLAGEDSTIYRLDAN